MVETKPDEEAVNRSFCTSHIWPTKSSTSDRRLCVGLSSVHLYGKLQLSMNSSTHLLYQISQMAHAVHPRSATFCFWGDFSNQPIARTNSTPQPSPRRPIFLAGEPFHAVSPSMSSILSSAVQNLAPALLPSQDLLLLKEALTNCH